MSATEDVERQVAVTVVVAVKEPSFLMAVQRIVGCVEIKDDFARRSGMRLEEYLHEQALDRSPIVPDLVIARRRSVRSVLQPVQGRLAGERRAIRAFGLQLSGQRGQDRIVAQLIVIDEVFISHPSGVERGDDPAAFGGSEIEAFRGTLCRHRGDLSARLKYLREYRHFYHSDAS